MRRGLIILFAVMALIFSVVLCACENEATTINEEEIVDVTSLATQSGVVIEGSIFKSNTKVKVTEVRTQQLSNEEWVTLNRLAGADVYKVFNISLYQGNEKIENTDRLTFSIPLRVFRLQSANLDKIRILSIDERGAIYPITTDGDEKTTRVLSFSTQIPKYFIVLKLDEVPPPQIEEEPTTPTHYYYKVSGQTPTLSSTGVKEHYRCTDFDCDKYFDLEFNEISYEDIILPEISHNFVLKVNGEKKSEFTVQKDGDYFKANLSGISLKKDDVLSLTTNDEYAYEFALYQKNSQIYTRNNYSREGKILYDVDAADISIEMYKTSYGGAYITVSGAKFEINYWSANARGTIEPDENGIVSFKAFKAIPVIQLKLYEVREDYKCDYNDFTLSTELPSGTVYLYDKTWVAFHKQGYYDVEFDLNTKVVTVSLTEGAPNMISGGNYGYYSVDSSYVVGLSAIGSKTNADNTDWNAFIPKFLAKSTRKKVYIYDCASQPASDLSVAENSVEYIKIDETDKNCIVFIQEGSYNICIHDYTHEVSVEYLGDASPLYVAEINRPHHGIDPFMKCELKATNEENILALESELFVYAGYTLEIYNDKDSTSHYAKLEDSADEEYASGLSRLYFHKGGVYKVYFNTSTLKINIELVRELTQEEILIPTKLYHHANGGHYQDMIILVTNENNEEELCALDVTITDEAKNYYFEYFVTDLSNNITDNFVNDISLDAEYEDYKVLKPTNGLEYGRLYIKKPGTYNIYINKYTHIIRIEKV